MSPHDAEGAVAELAASQHGAFSGRQAAEKEMTRRQLVRLIERGLVERQFPVRVGGRVIARLDFAWPDIRFGINPMGAQFHATTRRWRIDRRHGNRLTGAGWRVLTPTWEDHLEPTEFLAEARFTYQGCAAPSAS